MRKSPARLAYLAGVIDSDGYIGIKRNTYSMRVTGDSKQPTYSERVCVKQVQPEAVVLLKATFGGTYRIDKPSATRGRALYCWQVTDRIACSCLEQVLPYLRIKQRQASNCLLLRRLKVRSAKERCKAGRGVRGGLPRPSDLSEAMAATWAKAKALNTVGSGERRD